MQQPPDTVRLIRIFVSSPGDVAKEREVLGEVIQRINETQGQTHGVRLELRSWERQVVPQIGPRPQAVVDAQTQAYDVYLGLMSSQFGTPTGTHGSGTEKELRDAAERWGEVGRPWILFYFNDEPALSWKPADVQQYLKVCTFREDLKKLGIVGAYTGVRGSSRGLFEQVEQHLRLLIQNHLQPIPRDDPNFVALPGSIKPKIVTKTKTGKSRKWLVIIVAIIVAVALVAVVLRFTRTPLEKKARLDITSIPIGSEVFAATVDELGVSLHDEPEWDYLMKRMLGFRRLGKFTASMEWSRLGRIIEELSRKHRQGVVPLSLSLKPGNYVVFLTVPPSAPILNGGSLTDAVEEDSLHGLSINVPNGRPGRLYLIDLTGGGADQLIQVWQRRGASLAELIQMYPQHDTFKVNETVVKAQLADVLPEADIPAVLCLLRRGGKVVHRHRDIRLILQMSGSTGDLETLLKYRNWELVPINTPMGQEEALERPVARLEGGSITTPRGALLIREVQLSDRFPPGCTLQTTPGECYGAPPCCQCLIVWLTPRGEGVAAEIVHRFGEAYVLGSDGSRTNGAMGGMITDEKGEQKHFAVFAPPVTARDFTLFWPANPGIRLGR